MHNKSSTYLVTDKTATEGVINYYVVGLTNTKTSAQTFCWRPFPAAAVPATLVPTVPGMTLISSGVMLAGTASELDATNPPSLYLAFRNYGMAATSKVYPGLKATTLRLNDPLTNSSTLHEAQQSVIVSLYTDDADAHTTSTEASAVYMLMTQVVPETSGSPILLHGFVTIGPETDLMWTGTNACPTTAGHPIPAGQSSDSWTGTPAGRPLCIMPPSQVDLAKGVTPAKFTLASGTSSACTYASGKCGACSTSSTSSTLKLSSCTAFTPPVSS